MQPQTHHKEITMKKRMCLWTAMIGAGLLASATPGVSQAGVIQVGTGGTTNPGTWTTGNPVVTDSFTAMTVVPANFGALYDSGTGRVGGGTVSGDLYYAFTSRSLDRAGDNLIPIGSAQYIPRSPGTSFAGGQLMGASPSLSVIQAKGNWALGYNIGIDGTGTNNYFNSPRIDMFPARVQLFEVHIHFNASANDTATIVMNAYDNLPGQRQPVATDVPTYTQTRTVSSADFSFNSFQFISGHADYNGVAAPNTRWLFSNVAFATGAGEASSYLLSPEPATLGLMALGGLMISIRRRK